VTATEDYRVKAHGREIAAEVHTTTCVSLAVSMDALEKLRYSRRLGIVLAFTF